MADDEQDPGPRTDVPRCPICGGPDIFGNPCQSDKARERDR